MHITYRKEIPMEIVSCIGNITLHGKTAQVKAQIILADQRGNISGGCLFSDTLLLAGELQLVELIGSPVFREYEQHSGRMLLRTNKLKN